MVTFKIGEIFVWEDHILVFNHFVDGRALISFLAASKSYVYCVHLLLILPCGNMHVLIFIGFRSTDKSSGV